MADTPEIPEARDTFEKAVALTIAIMAIIASVVANHGDNAKTDAIIKTNQATDQWGYFQAKSLKQHMDELTLSLLEAQPAADAARVAKIKASSANYEAEKTEIKAKAEELTQESQHLQAINDRCDEASLVLQIAIILTSIAILARWKPLWFLGMALGAVGTVIGITSFTM
jgi:Domain of unknown function (DUF4337)